MYSCYARAGRDHEAAIALAYVQRGKAEDLLKGGASNTQIQTAFTKTAEMFESCAKGASVENAHKLYRQAARAYQRSSKTLKAARCYEHARDMNDAARLYRQVKHYDDAVRLLWSYPPDDLSWLGEGTASEKVLESREAETILETSRIFYVQNSRLESIVRLFESTQGKQPCNVPRSLPPKS